MRSTSHVFLALATLLVVSPVWSSRSGRHECARQAVQVEVYKPAFKTDIQREGVTKTVEVKVVRGVADQRLYRDITAIQGSQFAVASSPSAPVNLWDLKVIAPAFLPGDSDIRIEVNPDVGFTEFLNLKILQPVVVAVAPDWTLLADREGVQATLFLGTVEYSQCRRILGGINLNPPRSRMPDGSLLWEVGAMLECALAMEGTDAGAYVTRRVVEGGKSRIVFARTVESRQ
jgi:hypothetical protein